MLYSIHTIYGFYLSVNSSLKLSRKWLGDLHMSFVETSFQGYFSADTHKWFRVWYDEIDSLY